MHTIDVSSYAANWNNFASTHSKITVSISYYLHGDHSHRSGEEGSYSNSYSVNIGDISTNTDNGEIDVSSDGNWRGNSGIWDYKRLDYDKNTIARGTKGTSAIASRVWHNGMTIYVKVSACANEGSGTGSINPQGNITLQRINISNSAGSKADALASSLSQWISKLWGICRGWIGRKTRM